MGLFELPFASLLRRLIMQIFSSHIHIESGQPLGGYAGERLSIFESNELELNGLEFTDPVTGLRVELCSIDALYAGDLAIDKQNSNCRRILAASHSHFVPMLDSAKPLLGAVSEQALNAWRNALNNASRSKVEPTCCTVWKADVSIPIYRRFDIPDSRINRLLASRAGMFPNSNQPIDRNVYMFEFSTAGHTDAVILLHACHPVTRSDRQHISPDYIGALRASVRDRFGDVPCLFFLGCSGDVRPNFACKRINWLPRSRLNWRFEWPVSEKNEQLADYAYRKVVEVAEPWLKINLDVNSLHLSFMDIPLSYQPTLKIPCVNIGEQLRFEFVPFEMSHLFHLNAQKKNPMRFIVSCADNTLGYFPHPNQINAGGYEVDGSRFCMGLQDRVQLKQGALW